MIVICNRNRLLGNIEDSLLHKILKSVLDILKCAPQSPSCHARCGAGGASGENLVLDREEGQSERSK